MKKTSRKRWPIYVSIAGLWIAVPLVVAAVVMRNADQGVYGNSDAVLIPIMSAVFLFALGIPYLAFFAISASRRFYDPLPVWSFWSSIRCWLVLVLFLLGVLILGYEVVYWADSSHIPIVLVYSCIIAWLIWIRPYASCPLIKVAPKQADSDAEPPLPGQ